MLTGLRSVETAGRRCHGASIGERVSRLRASLRLGYHRNAAATGAGYCSASQVRPENTSPLQKHANFVEGAVLLRADREFEVMLVTINCLNRSNENVVHLADGYGSRFLTVNIGLNVVGSGLSRDQVVRESFPLL